MDTTLSTLKHLINLSKSTITSLSTTLPTTTATTTVPCPYNSNHRLPPANLFRHHLLCPSSPAPIDLSLIHSLHYPNTLQSPITTTKHTYPSNTDLCISLNDYYHTSLHSNFFYLDCPSVVSFPHDVTNNNNNNNNNNMLTLPAVLSAECADASINANNDDVADASVIGVVNLPPSEYYNVRVEISHWNDYGHDYPTVYSHGVCRLIACCYLNHEESLMEWILVNSPYYGVVIDVYMRDHIFVLFRVCLKAIVREATGHMVLIAKGERAGGDIRFDCPVLVRVMTWLASQFGILYGEVNGKLFAINMLKQALLTVSLKSVVFYDESSSGLSGYDGETESVNGIKEIDGRGRKGMVLVSQVAAAVASLHERFAFETRVKTIRASRFVPAYQRVQEHEYISKVADEERKKRPNYRPIIEHDGALWHRGGNQDSNKNKSQEELLAEERDYKRRRMSYRGKKIKRNTTQVMRDIIDEYMEEIKRANMAGQSSADESKPSSLSSLHTDKHKHDDIKQKTVFKESVSDISMRSSRYEGDVKEKSSKRRHKDNRSSTRTRDRSSSPNNRHKSKRKDRRSSSILPNEFEDRYDPSKSHDFD